VSESIFLKFLQNGLIDVAGDDVKFEKITVGPLPDAEDLAQMLTSPACGYSTANVTTLIDGAATLDNIRAGLNQIAKAAKQEDSVFIFFSGHGALIPSASNTSALVPVDCDPNDPWSSVLLEAELSSLLNAVKARKLLVMLDACHSAGAASLKHLDQRLTFGYEEKSLSRVASVISGESTARSRMRET
jgi:metacaspase-1